jgi:glycosyltransferase involved in cell wall biosynthesis
VVEVNGLLEAEVRSWWRRARVRAVHRRTLAAAARVVAVSPLLAEALVERYGYPRERIDVVPNGVDPDLFHPGDRAAARAGLGLPADAPVVVCVATFQSHHGRALLEEAARTAGATLVLVGAEGPGSPGVRCEGRVSHERVPAYLAAADVCAYVLKAPDRAFGFSPLKVFEYFAAGRPVVVASDLVEVRDLVTTRGAGVAVDLDVGALASALRGVFDDRSRAESMGAAGRAAALAEFTWARAAERVESSLRRATGT